MTDFQSLALAAAASAGSGDLAAAFALCDYLQERGDSRGERLRKRLKVVRRLLRWNDDDVATAMETYTGRALFGCLDSLAERRQETCQEWHSYLCRLLATRPGAELRRRIGGEMVAPPG